MAIKLQMEIKDILKELILAANTELNHNGHPDNFDLKNSFIP